MNFLKQLFIERICFVGWKDTLIASKDSQKFDEYPLDLLNMSFHTNFNVFILQGSHIPMRPI